MNTQNLSTLKIHRLTQAQYDRELAAGRIDENALYLTPDENDDKTLPLYEYANDNDGSALKSGLNEIIDAMEDGETKQIRFICNPYFSSIVWFATIYKNGTDAFINAYDEHSNKITLLRKLDLKTWVILWDNPTMNIGKEYYTTERICGSAIRKMCDSSGRIFYKVEQDDEWQPYVNAMGGVSYTLLWENNNSNSAFAAQTVSVPNMSAYTHVAIEYRLGADPITYGELPIKIIRKGSGRRFVGEYAGKDSAGREIVTMTDNSITFATGYHNVYEDNNWMIPLRIYGVNGI